MQSPQLINTTVSFVVVKIDSIMAVPQLVTPTGAFYVLIAVALFFLRQALYQTNTPYIKNLSQIPGWPLVGSLVQLGDTHAKTFGTWAKKYGPVFQVRLGNKVRRLHPFYKDFIFPQDLTFHLFRGSWLQIHSKV